MKALYLILLSILGAFIYRYFFDDARNLEYVAEQAYWQLLTLLLLGGFGCIKNDA